MRTTKSFFLTLCVLLATVLAGCHEGPPPDGDDASGDLPGGSSGDLPDDPAGDQLPDSDPSEPPFNDTMEPGEDQQEDTQRSLHLVGRLENCPTGHCLNATASNEGTDTYHISDVCIEPFSEEMHHDGERVQHREPTLHCAAFGTKPFAPNDQAHHGSSWDRQVWDDANETMVDAPPGTYEWTLTFRAYEEAEGGAHVDLEVTFVIEVEA